MTVSLCCLPPQVAQAEAAAQRLAHEAERQRVHGTLGALRAQRAEEERAAEAARAAAAAADAAAADAEAARRAAEQAVKREAVARFRDDQALAKQARSTCVCCRGAIA